MKGPKVEALLISFVVSLLLSCQLPCSYPCAGTGMETKETAPAARELVEGGSGWLPSECYVWT